MMVGCLMLKQLYNLGDDHQVAPKVDAYRGLYSKSLHAIFLWICPSHKFPFDPSDFVHFRKRIGEEGVGKIFAYSVELHGKGSPKMNVMFIVTAWNLKKWMKKAKENASNLFDFILNCNFPFCT